MSKSTEIDADALQPEIDIDIDTQKRILGLVRRLDQDDHYALLGVLPSADKSEIKRAYFDLMNIYHADRYFGKNTGKFAPLLLRITDVLTRANDTLSRNKTRREYDLYLESRRGTLGARASIAPTPNDSTMPSAFPSEPSTLTGMSERPAVAPIDIVGPIPKAPPAPVIDFDTPLDAPPDSAPVSRQHVDPNAPSRSTPPPSPKSDAARKLLSRKMGMRPRAPGSADPEQVRQAVRADLKARYHARKAGDEEKLKKILAKSLAAKEAGDWSEAVASLRLAVELRPEDPALEAQLNDVQAEADRALAPRFLEQAKYEEKDGQFGRAARSYERAARGKDSAHLFNKAAECLLHLETLTTAEQRMVVELARNAVTREHQKALYRLTLARAYDVAGMKTSALGEIKRALELEPENSQAKLLHKTLK